MKRVIETLEIIIIVLVLTFLLNTYLFSFYQVYGQSMEPSFFHGDLLLVWKSSKIERGDVVVFYETTEELLAVKRVIGKPNDNIKSDGNNIYVNGNLVVPFNGEAFTFQLSKDEYYLVGDNYESSRDSRDYGPIKQEYLIGKVVFRIWPIFNRE